MKKEQDRKYVKLKKHFYPAASNGAGLWRQKQEPAKRFVITMEQTSNYHHLQIGSKVLVNFMNEDVKGNLRGEIVSIHFHPGKVRYDIHVETWKEDLMDGEGAVKQYYTRLYNIEAMFVSVRE